MEPTEYDNLARLEGRHWWYAGMREIASQVLHSVSLHPSLQILDAGCGVGGGLEWLAAYGETSGIDLNPLAVGYAARISQRVAQASVQQLPFPADAFDLVTSFDVLYHLAVTNDEAALRECARVLRPGGLLLVRVPAYNWLRGTHDRQVHTRHRYDGHELRQKIERAGLTVFRLTHAGLTILPMALLLRLAQSFRSDMTARSDVAMPPEALNRMLTGMLAAEGVWLRRFDSSFGLSLLALAGKPYRGR